MRRDLVLTAALSVALAATGGVAQDAPAEQEEVVLGRSSASNFGPPEETQTVELGHGSRVRLAPDLSSPLLEIVAEGATAPVLERYEGWVRVRYGVFKGWVLEAGGDTGPVISAAPPDRQASMVRLDRVREILGGRARETTPGPYELLTDLRDDRLVGRLGSLVASLAESYRERFGLDPGAPRGEVIVIFDRERDYREFEREDLRLAGLETLGYTGQAILSAAESAEPEVSTLVVTYLGDREPELLREILVHELTHMLNRRAVGPFLPPWLEEGLAEDLAWSRVDSSGRLVIGSWGGSADTRHYSWARRGVTVSTSLSGSRAALSALLGSWRTPFRPELELLARLSWEALVTPASRALLYAQSGFLTRYLLDGAGKGSAQSFRAYLADVAGGEAGSDALWPRLEASPDALEEDFYLWMRRQAVAYGVRVPN